MQMYILGTSCVKLASVGQSVNLTILFFGKAHSEFLLLILKKSGDVTCFKLEAWLHLKARFPLDPYLAQFLPHFFKYDDILLCYRTFQLKYSILLCR